MDVPQSQLTLKEVEQPPYLTLAYRAHEECGNPTIPAQRFDPKSNERYDSQNVKSFDFMSSLPSSSNPGASQRPYKIQHLAREKDQQIPEDPAGFIVPPTSNHPEQKKSFEWRPPQLMKESTSLMRLPDPPSCSTRKSGETNPLVEPIFQISGSRTGESGNYHLMKSFESRERTDSPYYPVWGSNSLVTEEDACRVPSPLRVDQFYKDISCQDPKLILKVELVAPKKRKIEACNSNEILDLARSTSWDSKGKRLGHFSLYARWRREQGVNQKVRRQGRRLAINRAQDLFMKTQLLVGTFPGLKESLRRKLVEKMHFYHRKSNRKLNFLDARAERMAHAAGVSLIHIEIMNQILEPPLFESRALLEEAQKKAYAFLGQRLTDLIMKFDGEDRASKSRKGSIDRMRGRVLKVSHKKRDDATGIPWHLTYDWMEWFNKDLFEELKTSGYQLDSTFKTFIADKLLSLDCLRNELNKKEVIFPEIHVKTEWHQVQN